MRSHRPTSHCFSLPSAKGFGSKLDKEIGGDVKKSGSKLGKGFGKIFAVAGGAAVGAGMASFFKTGAADARTYEKAFDATKQIIKSTGGAANVTAEQVGNMSGRLEAMSGVDDEVIQKSANLLLTFKNVRNELGKGNDIFNRASKAGLDLAAAGFGSPESAAKMLGKALNDPVKGMSAMSRAGVTFTEQQQDQIKALVESGNTLKAQKVIMGEVESQVGGVAASQVSAADRAAVAWDNFRQQIGTALLPVIDRVATVFADRIIPAVAGFVSGMQNGTGAGGQFVSTISGLAGVVASVAGFLNRNRTAVVGLSIALGALVIVTKAHAAALAIQAAGGLAAMIKGLPIVTTLTKAWAAVQWVLNAALSANPIGLVVVGLVALGAGLIIAYKKSETFRKIVHAAFDSVKTIAAGVVGFFTKSVPAAFATVQSAASSALGWVKGNWPKILAILTGPFSIAAALIIKNWDSIKAGGVTVLAFIQGIPGKVTSIFSGAGTLLYNAGVQLMAGLASGITNKIEDAINAVRSGLSRLKGLLPGSPIKWGPLKNWNGGGAGKRLMDLVTLGITKGTPKTIKVAEEAFGKIGDALKSERDKMKSTLDGLKSDFASLAESVSKSLTGDLFGVTATEAVAASQGVAAVAARTVGQNFVDNLLAKRTELTGLMASFTTLKGWGLDPAFLSQLFASGNGALITELAGMGQAGALSTGALFADVTSLGNTLGNSVASNDPLASRIDTTNATLTRIETQLGFLGSEIGKELNGVAAKAQRDKQSRKGKK